MEIRLDYDYRHFDNPGGEFIIYGDNYKEIFGKINPEFRPKVIVTSSEEKSFEGIPIITLDEYKNLDNNERVFFTAPPDGLDFRPCVRELYKLLNTLERDVVLFINYKFTGVPLNRFEELCEKEFFLTEFRFVDEAALLAENLDAKVDLLVNEYGVPKETAASAEVFLHDVNTPEMLNFFENHIFDKDYKTLYTYGASQFVDLFNAPGFKEKFLETAKKNSFNVSLNLQIGANYHDILNLIKSTSLNPGDRVMFTLCPDLLSFESMLFPERIISLKKKLEKRGVKLFVYLFPLLYNKELTPYEKIIPPNISRTDDGTFDFQKHINDFSEYVPETRNIFAAYGVRFFVNTSLNKSKELCYLNISHYTKTGNRILGEEIIGLLENSDFLGYKDKISEEELSLHIETVRISRRFKGIDEYCEMLKKMKRRGKSGAIVMNCNPLTNGHMYLIKTAAKQVDNLFVFVVEEDRSEFPFMERLELVIENCKDLENVMVLPSGKFIISQLTFPGYFLKSSKIEFEPSGIPSVINDVSAFAVKIAAALGITVRFAGEEPLDPVTREYNRVMANLLPFYGVEFVEIKRKEKDGEVISASRVRKLLHEGNFEAIKPLVPQATYRYLEKKYGNLV
jgi:cytidyltransferase-like protein